MRLLLDTSRARFEVSRPAVEKVDQNGQQRRTRTQEPMWTVQLVAWSHDEDGAEVLLVTVAGVPPKLTRGQQVNPVDLEAIPWTQGDKSGVAFRVRELAPVGAQSKPSAA